MRRTTMLVLLFGSLILLNPAHANKWDDIKKKSGDLKEKVLTEENKKKAKEYLEDHKDEIKAWSKDAGKSTKDFFKKL